MSQTTAPDGADPRDVPVRRDTASESREGKIVVDDLYYENLAVAAQLGLLPQDDSATV